VVVVFGGGSVSSNGVLADAREILALNYFLSKMLILDQNVSCLPCRGSHPVLWGMFDLEMNLNSLRQIRT